MCGRSLLSDHDVSSMMIGKELFFERGRYALNIKFEVYPSTREGRVFRESKRIARVLQQKSIPPGSFQFQASEQLKYELTKQEGGVNITVRSELTGEIVKRGSLVLP
ncbi:MAG: hypothetical protein P1Q69_20725 [Candidatus Thorarchaeota archaeon]|nr:hypothetical protein [Candidatus Thorarchaeota archaeon]